MDSNNSAAHGATPNTDVLTVEGLMAVTGWSKSYIYKLTCTDAIPHFKPMGKTIFFRKSEIEEFLLSKKPIRAAVPNKEDVEAKAIDYVYQDKPV